MNPIDNIREVQGFIGMMSILLLVSMFLTALCAQFNLLWMVAFFAICDAVFAFFIYAGLSRAEKLRDKK